MNMVAGFQFMNMIAGFCYYTESSVEAAGTPSTGLLFHMGLGSYDLHSHMGLTVGIKGHAVAEAVAEAPKGVARALLYIVRASPSFLLHPSFKTFYHTFHQSLIE